MSINCVLFDLGFLSECLEFLPKLISNLFPLTQHTITALKIFFIVIKRECEIGLESKDRFSVIICERGQHII